MSLAKFHFSFRIFLIAFYHPHFSILILSSAFFYPPSAIRRHPVLTLQIPRNPSRGCWSLRKLHFSKIIWQLALGFSMDLRLNATRRSINLSVCLVFNLEAGRFKFLGENLLCSKSQRKTHQIPLKFQAGLQSIRTISKGFKSVSTF